MLRKLRECIKLFYYQTISDHVKSGPPFNPFFLDAMMDDCKLDQLDIHPTTIEGLNNGTLRYSPVTALVSFLGLFFCLAAGFHYAIQTLHYSAAELQAATKLPPKLITAALQTIAARVAPKPTTALGLAQTARSVQLGDAVLDELLGGGLPLKALTELSGASGSGKTQLALQWCLQVQIPKAMGGLEGGEIGGCKNILQLFAKILSSLFHSGHLY